MDLDTVTAVHLATERGDLGSLGAGEAVLAGGTWLFSEPQDDLHTLVDLTGLGWPPLTLTADGLSIAATCTLAELGRFRGPDSWAAVPLLAQCCSALAGSFKILNAATVGGNVCLALPAGPMISMAATLDGVARLWAVDGSEREVPVAQLVTGERRTLLRPGEVLRAVDLPVSALRARTALRRAALAPQGRSGAVVAGRRDLDGGFVMTVTAATERPHRFGFDGLPLQAELAAAVDSVPRWFDDPHGAPDWRRAVTLVLAEQVRQELS